MAAASKPSPGRLLRITDAVERGFGGDRLGFPAAAAVQRSSPVGKAKVSPAARQKALRKRTKDGQPVHSFRTLLQDLANLTRNSVRFGDARPTTILARPTPTQTRAFNLLGLKIAA